MEKSFILGIGSQRAGSTFIARLLDLHPEIAIHPLKELHYFDTIFGLRDEKFLKEFCQNQLEREINQLCSANRFEFITPTWQWYVKTNFKLLTKPISEIKYFELFSALNERKNISFIGESTPEYMLLSEEQVAKMRGFVGNAYVILICRNPVKRIISSFRLLRAYGGKAKPRESAALDRLFLELIDSNNLWTQRQIIYNNYLSCIQNYSKFFDRVLILSYDDVVDCPQVIIDRLSNFLGTNFNLKEIQSFFKNKINALSIKYNPSQEVVSRLEILLKSQSQQLEDLFGKPLIH